MVSGANRQIEQFSDHGRVAIGWDDDEPNSLADQGAAAGGTTDKGDARDDPVGLVVGYQNVSISDRFQDLHESACLIGTIKKVKLTLCPNKSVQVYYIQRLGTTNRGLLCHGSHLGPLGTRKSGEECSRWCPEFRPGPAGHRPFSLWCKAPVADCSLLPS